MIVHPWRHPFRPYGKRCADTACQHLQMTHGTAVGPGCLSCTCARFVPPAPWWMQLLNTMIGKGSVAS